MKPQLADDADIDTLTFPLWAMPKIDGVRAMNINGTLTGRSLDPFEGYGITEFFSEGKFRGLDGEMTLGDNPAGDGLCRTTTGAMGRFKGVTEMADLYWWVFDWLGGTGLTYEQRYNVVRQKVKQLDHPRVLLVEYAEVTDRDGLEQLISFHAAAGYEGTITRNPKALIKEGRPTKKGQQLMRFKPWMDSEILVTGVTEGQKNGNEAKTNTLGRTERSSAKAGMIPNGQVGTIHGTLLADVVYMGKVLFKKGLPIDVSPGAMSVKDRLHYFAHQDEIVGHIVKFQHMVHGTLNVPRMPGYLSHRLKQDMSK